MIIEGIATSLEDVRNLNSFGAGRIELCSSMDRDGLTPDFELVRRAVSLSEIPINVMVRLHDHSFHYDKSELVKMAEQVQKIKSFGANGLVVGTLNENHDIDRDALEYILVNAGEMEITFHKAFDNADDQFKALEILTGYHQIKTILTSGGMGTVEENITKLRQLIEKAQGSHIEIMPGGGLKVENIESIYPSLKTESIHFGTGIREGSSYNNPISKEKIQFIKKITSAK